MKQLSLIEKAFFLKNISIFQELDLDFLLAISDKVHQDIYDQEDVLFAEGQIGHTMYLIAQGEVALYKEKKQIRQIEKQGFFGDASLFNEKARKHTAVCTKDSLLLLISRSELMSIISECPTVAISLLQHYTESL